MGPILKCFVDVAPRILRYNFRDDSCLNASRVTLEVLRAFKVSAIPLSVYFWAMNAVYLKKLIEAGDVPSEDMLNQWVSEGAWALGIDTKDTAADKYAGHLVVIAQDQIIDASARQFHRPERKISMPDIFVGQATRRFLKGKGPEIFQSDEGAQMCYAARLDDTSYEQMPGFQWHSGNYEAALDIATAMCSVMKIHRNVLRGEPEAPPVPQ